MGTAKLHARTVGNVSNERIEEERPAQGICERFLQLIELVVLVSNPLLVHPHTLDRQYLILLAQPSAVELVVRHNPEEEEANAGSEQAGDKKDDLPRFDDRASLAATDCNSICNDTTKDLCPSVEAEPNGGA